MTEEQCLRPSDGIKRKRITGWLAGHEIHLEIEDVLDKIKIKIKIKKSFYFILLLMLPSDGS